MLTEEFLIISFFFRFLFNKPKTISENTPWDQIEIHLQHKMQVQAYAECTYGPESPCPLPSAHSIHQLHAIKIFVIIPVQTILCEFDIYWFSVSFR